MAKKKKAQNDEAKEPVVPIKDVAKDIDDIFATKSVPKPSSEEPVKTILNTLKPTTAMPDSPDEPEGQDLETVQSQVRAAKSSRVRPSSAVLKDDDFADIRGLKKRKRTADGLTMYREDELNLGQGGDTPLCPFDCDCCF